MALREGDSLTLHRQAVVWLSKYDALKPRASMTRILGSDAEADREEMERILYVELRAAVLRELETRSTLEELLGKSINLTRLTRHCELVMSNGPDGPEAQESRDWPAPEASDATRRKARRRSKRRKA